MGRAAEKLQDAYAMARSPSSRTYETLPLHTKVMAYGSALRAVGEGLHLSELEGLDEVTLDKHHRFARQCVKYIQTKVYWLFNQVDLTTRGPVVLPPPTSAPPVDTLAQLDLDEELRAADAGLEAAWKEWER